MRAIFSGGQGLLKTAKSGPGKNITSPVPQGDSSGDIKRELEAQVAAMAEANDAEHKISVFRDERGIVIRIMDRAFFDEGRAELKETAKESLRKIAPIIKKSDRHLRVEAHTDNVPINTAEFKSNWELSVRRATEVVRHLIDEYDFPPERISASGYAEYRPVAANDTAENRALNRRIELILVDASNPNAP